MAIRPESRWWIVTLVLVGLLFGLSALALDRPNVVWSKGVAHCPHCRAEAGLGARRCGACREEFDWSVAPEEASPLSPWSLSALEEEQLRQRVRVLTTPVAVERLARELALSPEVAQAYLESVGSGLCGWCGGTGQEPPSPAVVERPPAKASVTCQICLGRKQCIACGGDRHMRLGDVGAAEALERYRARIADLRATVPLDEQRAELTRLQREFLERHAGTVEAQHLILPRSWRGPNSEAHTQTLVEVARERLDALLRALAAP